MRNSNITIATLPSATGNLTIANDLELIKTALLYGDKIKLYSISTPVFQHMRMAAE